MIFRFFFVVSRRRNNYTSVVRVLSELFPDFIVVSSAFDILWTTARGSFASLALTVNASGCKGEVTIASDERAIG